MLALPFFELETLTPMGWQMWLWGRPTLIMDTVRGGAFLLRGSDVGVMSDPTNGTWIAGTTNGDQFGLVTSRAGDVNGDGVLDISYPPSMLMKAQPLREVYICFP